MTMEEWIISPELTALHVGTARLSWEAQPSLEQALDELRAVGLVQEAVRHLRYDGSCLICPDPTSANHAQRRLAALGLDLELPQPRAHFRESVRAVVTQRGRYIRQAGAEQFGIVDLRLAPLPGTGIVRYRCELPPDGPISPEFLPAIARGVRHAVFAGGPQGYPLANLAVTLIGGVEHPVDSRPRSFEIAARLAMQQALEAAGALLEPVRSAASVTYRVAASSDGPRKPPPDPGAR